MSDSSVTVSFYRHRTVHTHTHTHTHTQTHTQLFRIHPTLKKCQLS